MPGKAMKTLLVSFAQTAVGFGGKLGDLLRQALRLPHPRLQLRRPIGAIQPKPLPGPGHQLHQCQGFQ